MSASSFNKNHEYHSKYDKEHYNNIRFNVSKNEHIPELLNLAVEKGFAESKSQYILEALKEQLKEDGIW